MPTRPALFGAALVVWLLAPPALAQEASSPIPDAAPAHLAHAEGDVDLVHEGVLERADAPILLMDGDVLRTRVGRAEMVFADGTLLHLDHHSELEVLDGAYIRLTAGRIAVRVAATATEAFLIDTAAARVQLDTRGEYVVSADSQRASLDVGVARGLAQLLDGPTRVVVRSGQLVTVAGPGAVAAVRPYNSARLDTFAAWINARATEITTAVSSSRLPAELRPYGTVLDQHGRWDYVAPHGFVWFPSVAAGWRPYFDGSWNHTRFGWTWFGRDPFAWPTHHFGRWGYNGAFWYWIPARTWGPAWVSWAFAPGFVSWSPLGWDGRPVLGFWDRRDHPAFWPASPWRAWTIVPRDHFVPRRLVRSHAIDGSRLDERTRRAVIAQRTAPPAPVAHAVPRGTLSSPAVRRTPPRADAVAPERGARAGAVRRPPPGVMPPPTSGAAATESNRQRRPDAGGRAGGATRDRDTGGTVPAQVRDPRRVAPVAPAGAQGTTDGSAPAAGARPSPRERRPDTTRRTAPPPDASGTRDAGARRPPARTPDARAPRPSGQGREAGAPRSGGQGAVRRGEGAGRGSSAGAASSGSRGSGGSAATGGARRRPPTE